MTLAEIEAVRRSADLVFDRHAVDSAYDRMAKDITRELCDTNPVILCVMSGGLVPTGELFTRLDFPVQLDYLHATRYQGTQGGLTLNWLARPLHDLKRRTVLVVDDILDEGLTLSAIMEYCREQDVEAVYSAVLVEKKHHRKAPGLTADFVGLEVEDRYVFGCGMDFHGYWRNLPAIYAVAGTT
ncbi:hypoxanthine phosphoribosyltransferase [Thiogranum longum]|uniref:Hypoxanthine phosphoribosyltransferase n=1 Tax=Thiogranum longum TaxID=1537524 RepID=A0A4R1H951_9GAMM|nr:hypoxanthine-guanine phosphoribosyltransferase [Thiogranum longum]TCK18387.1 hypoxanthine phosphoribosyltransferase [Thiogranum longum]